MRYNKKKLRKQNNNLNIIYPPLVEQMYKFMHEKR